MIRPKPGMPSPWINLPVKTMRFPEKIEEELRTVAKLLDSGAIGPADILKLLNPEPSAPTHKEIQAQIELLTQLIAAGEDNLTAVEMGLLVASLESAAKEVDQIFTKKAKAKALELIAIVNEQKQTEENHESRDGI